MDGVVGSLAGSIFGGLHHSSDAEYRHVLGWKEGGRKNRGSGRGGFEGSSDPSEQDTKWGMGREGGPTASDDGRLLAHETHKGVLESHLVLLCV